MKKLSERIKSLRLPNETQSEFAERLGTTQASISRYLNGRQPDRETLIKIAAKTGVTLDWLLTGAPPMSAEGPARGKGPRELLQAASAYVAEVKDFTPREKKAIEGLLQEALENKDLRKEIVNIYESKAK